MGYFYNMSTVYIGVATPFTIDTEALKFFVFVLSLMLYYIIVFLCCRCRESNKFLSRAQLGLFVEHILSLTKLKQVQDH